MTRLQRRKASWRVNTLATRHVLAQVGDLDRYIAACGRPVLLECGPEGLMMNMSNCVGHVCGEPSTPCLPVDITGCARPCFQHLIILAMTALQTEYTNYADCTPACAPIDLAVELEHDSILFVVKLVTRLGVPKLFIITTPAAHT